MVEQNKVYKHDAKIVYILYGYILTSCAKLVS